MEDFSSTGQLVTLGLVDSSIGAMAEGLALVNVEALVAKDVLLSLEHSMAHCPAYTYDARFRFWSERSRSQPPYPHRIRFCRIRNRRATNIISTMYPEVPEQVWH